MATKTKSKKATVSKKAAEEKVKKTKKTAAAEKPAKKTKKVKAEKPVKATKKTSAKKAAKAEKPTKATKKTGKKSAAKASSKKAAADMPKPIKEKMTKTQLLEHLAEQSGVDKKEVKKVMEALETTMIASVRKKGLGEFMLPGLFKIITKHIPAKKGGEKKISFGREIITKAKPATTKVKIRPMKKVKDAALS